MQSILVCVDFSDVEGPLIDAAVSLARAYGCKLHVLHVGEPDPTFVGYDVGPKTVRDQLAATLREEHRRVEAIAEQAMQRGGSGAALIAQSHLLRGPYVATILEEAERLHVDLIVLGSHGHGRIHGLLVGSVTAGVLRGAKVPVLVVPHPSSPTAG